MSQPPVVLLGGTGFVGRTLCEHLIRAGHRLRVLTRRADRARELRPLPGLSIVEADVHDAETLRVATAGAGAVINLVGILNERGDNGAGFRRAHVDLTRNVLAALRANGIPRYLHMSALNAAPEAPSHYLRTKGEAEALALAAEHVATTVFRPSVIFGPGDGLFCRFDKLLQMAPVLPLACAAARFQPVYVGDVAAAFTVALPRVSSHGQRYDLGGPAVMTLEAVVRYVLSQTGRQRLIIPLGAGGSRLLAEVMEHLPGKPFSRDNLRSASLDSVLGAGRDGLSALGLARTAIEASVPLWLGRAGARDAYDTLRQQAHR